MVVGRRRRVFLQQQIQRSNGPDGYAGREGGKDARDERVLRGLCLEATEPDRDQVPGR